MDLNTYLFFDGQCEAAFKFYAQCLGGKIEAMMTHGDSPIADQVPAERHNTILHARLVVGEEVLMGSDSPPEHYEKPQGFSVSLSIDDPAEAERIFHTLAEKDRCGCRSRRLSGLPALACLPISSEFRG